MAPIQDDQPSLLHIERISQYVSVTPACLASPLPSICASILSPLLLSYYPPVRGIVLAYENVQISSEPPRSAAQLEHERRRKAQQRRRGEEPDESEEDNKEHGDELLLQIVDEYSAVFLWVTADLLVWRPEKNVWIEARVTHQSRSHITLSHLNAFPVSVLKEQLPGGWQWHSTEEGGSADGPREEDGYWCDGDGMPVLDVLRVGIKEWDFRAKTGQGKGFVKVEGSLVGEGEERAKDGEVRRRERVSPGKSALRRAQKEEVVEVVEVD